MHPHYHKPIDFIQEKAVHDAATNLKYLKNTYEQLLHWPGRLAQLQAFLDKSTAAMDEVFTAASGITANFGLAKWINSDNYTAEVKGSLAASRSFCIVFVEEVLEATLSAWLRSAAARTNRDFCNWVTVFGMNSAAQGIKLSLDTKDE